MRLAGFFAKFAKGGEVYLLEGMIGTGKTVFVKGFAKALGSADTPVSASFNLMKTYRARLNIHHFDLFRIKEADIANLGIEDYINRKDGVLIIEWASPSKKLFSQENFFEFEMFLEKGDERKIIASASGGQQRRALDAVKNLWTGRESQ